MCGGSHPLLADLALPPRARSRLTPIGDHRPIAYGARQRLAVPRSPHSPASRDLPQRVLLRRSVSRIGSVTLGGVRQCRNIAFIAWRLPVTGNCRASRGSQKSKLPTTRRQSRGLKSSIRLLCVSFGTGTVWWPPSLLIETSDLCGESLQFASNVFED